MLASSVSACELQELTTELQILAEESDRLRRGLARLLELTEDAHCRSRCQKPQTRLARSNMQKDSDNSTRDEAQNVLSGPQTECHALKVGCQKQMVRSENSGDTDKSRIFQVPPLIEASSTQIEQMQEALPLAQQTGEFQAIAEYYSAMIPSGDTAHCAQAELIQQSASNTEDSAALEASLAGANPLAGRSGIDQALSGERGGACEIGYRDSMHKESTGVEREAGIEGGHTRAHGQERLDTISQECPKVGPKRSEAKTILNSSEPGWSSPQTEFATKHASYPTYATGRFNIEFDLQQQGRWAGPADCSGTDASCSVVRFPQLTPELLRSSLIGNGPTLREAVGTSETVRYCV